MGWGNGVGVEAEVDPVLVRVSEIRRLLVELTRGHLVVSRACCRREIWLGRSRKLRWNAVGQLRACEVVRRGIGASHTDMRAKTMLLWAICVA